MSAASPSAVSEAVRILWARRRILVFTGAGISTESGIPDFRGPDGLWTRVDPEEFTIGRYLADPAIRTRAWRTYLEGGLRAIIGAAPNPAHFAVTELWRSGRWAGCITQNIDGLHQAAGLPEDEIAELHGNLRSARCFNCGMGWAVEEVLAKVAEGEDDPACPTCGGIIKTATVMFGELLPEDQLARAAAMSSRADAVLAVGSTLSVYPAADFAVEAAVRGAPLIILNMGSTDHDNLASVKIEAPAGTALPALVDELLGRSGPSG